MTEQPTTITDAWRAVFDAEELEAHAAEELSGFRLGFTGEHGRFLCFVLADEERQAATVFAICPFTVAESRRRAAGELLHRVNFGLPLGCFELDLEDGEVRFRTTIAFGKAALDDKLRQSLLTTMLWANVSAMDRYLPSLTACIQQGLEAEPALSLVEGPPEE